jgi:hypothetical protein
MKSVQLVDRSARLDIHKSDARYGSYARYEFEGSFSKESAAADIE